MFYYLQDTWRVTQKLTLSYGLRWDTWFPDSSLNSGQGGRYDVTNNTVYIPGVGGVSMSGNSQTQWLNLAPRIGIAYSVNPKTVIRAGYGRGYSIGTFGWTFNSIAADVYPSIVNQNLNAPSSYQPVFPLSTAPPAVVFPTIPANGRLPLMDGVSVSYIPANQKIPYVDQWNFTVEHQIGAGISVSAGYIGNIGRHENGGFNINDAIPGPGPFNPRRPLYNLYGLTQGIFDKCNCTSSNYNALQIQATKRFTNGYSLQASYTWSKSLDYGTFGTPTNQYNAHVDYGPSDWDRTHVFTLAHTLELPFGPGHRFLAHASGPMRVIAAGWAFRGITSYSSGLPFSPSLGNQGNLNSDQTERPQVVNPGNPETGINQSRNLWFNPTYYGIPGPYVFGNAGRNTLRGPNYFEADWSLSKNFHFTERVGLEFRWEVFNAFNRTNLANPNSQVDSGAAGVIQDIATPMRNMQFGAHITF
jgi:hypothetical protein